MAEVRFTLLTKEETMIQTRCHLYPTGNSTYCLVLASRIRLRNSFSGRTSWVGCPQALQSRKSTSSERETRIWLADNSLEIAFGAEVSFGFNLYKISKRWLTVRFMPWRSSVPTGKSHRSTRRNNLTDWEPSSLGFYRTRQQSTLRLPMDQILYAAPKAKARLD
jgi:hypothetical protein